MRVNHKIVISVDAEIMQWIDSEVRKDRLRNRSRGFEYCAKIARSQEIN